MIIIISTEFLSFTPISWSYQSTKIQNNDKIDEKLKNSLKIAKKHPFFAIFSLNSTVILQKTLDYHNINRVSIILLHFMFISIHKNKEIRENCPQNSQPSLNCQLWALPQPEKKFFWENRLRTSTTNIVKMFQSEREQYLSVTYFCARENTYSPQRSI